MSIYQELDGRWVYVTGCGTGKSYHFDTLAELHNWRRNERRTL